MCAFVLWPWKSVKGFAAVAQGAGTQLGGGCLWQWFCFDVGSTSNCCASIHRLSYVEGLSGNLAASE